MMYKDKFSLVYKAIKKNDKYCLLIRKRNTLTGEYFYDIELKGKKNILTFMKNNGFVKYEEEKCKNTLFKN